MNGNHDVRDLLLCLNEAGARYLVAGAYAVIYHTEPRYTKDFDVWVEPAPENAQNVWMALLHFGAPMADLTVEDLCNPDIVFQMGVEPNRIDVIMDVEGLRFGEAWEKRVTSTYEDQQVFILSYDDTLLAKQAVARKQDQLDAQRLEAIKKKKKA